MPVRMATDQGDSSQPHAEQQVVVTRLQSGESITLDGQLNEPIWRRATGHDLQPIASEEKGMPWDLNEPGQVTLAYDADYLYLAFEMADTDLIAEGTQDNQHHYKKGDVVEIFIKPADQPYYWELYYTPRQHRTLFVIPGAGRVGVPSTFAEANKIPQDFRGGVQLQGSLNDGSDRDGGWVAEFAVPRSLIESRGQRFGADGDAWDMLAARYNFNIYREYPGGLCTTYPQLSKRNFHMPREFGAVTFKQ